MASKKTNSKSHSKSMDKSEMDEKAFQNHKGKGKARKERPSKSSESKFACSAGRPTNDPRWYLNNPVLSRDVGSIWFSKPIGSYLPPTAITTTTPTLNADQYEPGIMAIPSITTWGGNVLNGNYDVSTDPINLAAQKLYQFVVHANSRNISYDKKDLMMTMMAIDGIYQLLSEAIRAYRLTAQFDPENKYVTNLLTALHWNAADLRSKVAQFRYFINWAITRVNKFFVPAIFAIFPAHLSCYEHIYADRPSNKAQLIAKYSAGVWLYDDTKGAMDYCSKFQSVNGVNVRWYNTTGHTVSDFSEAVTTMISRVENAQYLGVMQGDLLKAFGIERMAQFAYLNIDMPIAPVYDEEFMLKLHNADISETLAAHQVTPNVDSLLVYRDDTNVTGNMVALMCSELGTTNLNAWRKAHGMMIDLPTHIPADASTVLLMSLYKILGLEPVTADWHIGDGSPGTYYVGQLPPEILVRADIYYDPDIMNFTTMHTWSQSLANAGYLSRFETYPLLTQKGVTDGSQVPFMWKTDNVTAVSYESVRRMFEVIYWSLWASSEITTDVTRETRV